MIKGDSPFDLLFPMEPNQPANLTTNDMKSKEPRTIAWIFAQIRQITFHDWSNSVWFQTPEESRMTWHEWYYASIDLPLNVEMIKPVGCHNFTILYVEVRNRCWRRQSARVN